MKIEVIVEGLKKGAESVSLSIDPKSILGRMIQRAAREATVTVKRGTRK